MMSRKLERILIAVDDDGGVSDAAIQQGLALASAEGAQVMFAYVTSILGEQFAPGNELARVPERETVPILREAVTAAELAGVPVESELLVGYAPTQIASLAEEWDADLVIAGSHHYTGAKRMLRGSTSRALLDATRRPLLIVTAPAREPAHV